MITVQKYWKILKKVFLRNACFKHEFFLKIKLLDILQVGIYNILLALAILIPLHLFFVNLAWVEIDIWSIIILVVVLNLSNTLVSFLLSSKDNIEKTFDKVKELKESIAKNNAQTLIEIDGEANSENAQP